MNKKPPTQEIVADRIKELCEEEDFSVYGIAKFSSVPKRTVESILNGESQNPGIVNIKKLCDGLGITLGEFFSTKEFDDLLTEENQ